MIVIYFASTKDMTCTDALLFVLFYVVHVRERKWSPVETFFSFVIIANRRTVYLSSKILVKPVEL